VCVLAFAWACHPRWRLVAAGNRDEFHARDAAPLAEWDDLPGVLAGRDLRSGGTWMGVSRQGRFAVVTNVRGEAGVVAPRSRGDLVTDALTGKASGDPADYGAYNLIASDRRAATFSTNRPAAAEHPLAPGVYGVANAGLDEPWPKTVRLKAIVSDWLAGPADEPDQLFAGLAEETPEDLALSGIFIRNPVYGTRCSTVVAVAAAGAGTIIERRFTSEGEAWGETRLAFVWR
jgi:uncharacterized protein with NRDE domain